MALFSDNMLTPLEPGKRAYRIYDERCPGLFLEVLPSGLKKWRLRREIDGRRRQVTLGTYPGLTIAKARKLAESPAESASSFSGLAMAWRAAHGASLSRLSADILNRVVLPALGAMEPARITSTDILIKVIRPLAEAGDLDGAARARRVCGEIFRFGQATGLAACDPAASLPELIHRTVTGRITPVIDPMAPTAAGLPQGHTIEARPHHYLVKRNPRLAGLNYDPSHPGR